MSFVILTDGAVCAFLVSTPVHSFSLIVAKKKGHVFSHSLEWCLPAPSTIKPEETKIVCVSAHAEEERVEHSRTGNYRKKKGTLQKSSRQMGKCKRTRKRQCTSEIWIYV